MKGEKNYSNFVCFAPRCGGRKVAKTEFEANNERNNETRFASLPRPRLLFRSDIFCVTLPLLISYCFFFFDLAACGLCVFARLAETRYETQTSEWGKGAAEEKKFIYKMSINHRLTTCRFVRFHFIFHSLETFTPCRSVSSIQLHTFYSLIVSARVDGKK